MQLTTANVKTLLDISDSSYDTKIALLLPQVIRAISDECKNIFPISNPESVVGTFANSGSTITLTDSIDTPLSANDLIYVYNTDFNDGLYQVSTYTSDIITLASNYTLKDESSSSFSLYVCEFPYELITVIANILQSKFSITGIDNLKREKMPDYEVEYFDNQSSNSNMFTSQDNNTLNKYRNVYWFYE